MVEPYAAWYGSQNPGLTTTFARIARAREWHTVVVWPDQPQFNLMSRELDEGENPVTAEEPIKMEALDTVVSAFRVGMMNVEVHPDRESLGAAAARATAKVLREIAEEQDTIAAIFATGASQLATLDALTKMEGLPWERVQGFHLDEYVGLPINHAASFRAYLRKHLTQKVRMKTFYEIDGTAPDPEDECRSYATRLRANAPRLCLLGIGENGHLAFNDPSNALFNDPLDVKVVELDPECKQQQVAEGWFNGPEDVPQHAISLTIPALMRVPKLIVSVPGSRKAAVMRRSVTEAISPQCPATVLRDHPDVTVYLDRDSAAELNLQG